MSKINTVLKFLQAARSLAKQGVTKEQILDFAKTHAGVSGSMLYKTL